MRTHLQPAAFAVAIVSAFPSTPVFAADVPLESIIVTATRFESGELATPANVAVIDEEDIRQSAAANLPDLLAQRAGIEVRSLYGSKATNSVIDLRGFGENGNLRTLVMIDGRRMESLEFAAVNWNDIPLESVERIEIIRGSANVMHGDQATAGVINIITRRARSNAASVAATAGSFGDRGLQASISRGDTPLRYAFSVGASESDEYRRNNNHRGTAANGRLATDLRAGEAFVDLGWSENSDRLPGALTQAQYDDDPRASETTDSWFKRENHYVRPGVRWQFAGNLDAAVELTVERSHNRSWLSNWPSYRDVRTQQLALTPRLRWAHGLGDWNSATVVGIDLADATLDQDRHNNPWSMKTNTVELRRKGTGVYIHNTTHAGESLAVTLGLREQRYRQRATETAGAPALEASASKTAGEFGLAWQASRNWKLFARTASTFRYPVLDEMTTWGGFASPAPRPERGVGKDVGAEWRTRTASVQLTVYDLKMTDEIAYNPMSGQNENLQKTEHRGVEIDARWLIAGRWQLNAAFNDKIARFSEGANRGNTIPLVARQRYGLGLAWLGGALGTHSLQATRVGKRYFGGDDANAQEQLPAYTTFDWQSRWRLGAWDVSAKLLNLTDRKYAPMGFNYGGGASYYVANPRSAYLTVRYHF